MLGQSIPSNHEHGRGSFDKLLFNTHAELNANLVSQFLRNPLSDSGSAIDYNATAFSNSLRTAADFLVTWDMRLWYRLSSLL